MKKLILAAVATVVGSVFGEIRNVPADGDLATVVAGAKSGDEVVIAASETPYELTATLTVPAGVTVRGATGDWKDVVLRMTVTGARAVTLSENATLSAVTVTGAEYQSSGAGVYVSAAGALLENCRVTGCKSANASNGNYTPAGGAVANNGGTVRGCVIDGNGRASTGANQHGPIAYQSLVAGALMENCVITNNVEQFGQSGGTLAKSSGYSGMVLMNAGTMRYTLIADNDAGPITVADTALFGTAVALICATVEHCTIVRNRYYAGWRRTNLYGVMCSSKSNTFRNNIVAGNGAWGETEYDDLYLPAGVTAENNMTGCLSDLGPGDVSLPATAIAEIGAYPSGATGFVCSFSASEWAPVGLKTVWLMPNVAGASGSCTYEWDLDGDGVYETSAGAHVIPFEPVATGVYPIGLRVTSGGVSTTFEAAINVRQGVFFVDDSSANPTPPYATEETAATSVNDALALAQGVPGSEVRILTGNYPLSAMLNISRCVRVRGVGATRDDVVLTAPNAARAAKLTGFGACLADLTVTSGYGVQATAGSMVTNCRVTASTQGAEVSGSGIYNVDANVLGCTIDGITGNYKTAGAYCQEGVHALADRCVITNCANANVCNGGNYPGYAGVFLSGGEMRNSFIAGVTCTYKKSSDTGGGAALTVASGARFVNGAVLDCTVTATTAYGHPVRADAGSVVLNCILNGNTRNTVADEAAGSEGAYTNTYMSVVTDTEAANGCRQLTGSEYVRIPGGLYTVPDSSALIDNGANEDWMAVAQDIAGHARLVNGRVDVGPVENQAQKAAFWCRIDTDRETALGRLTTTLTAYQEGAAGGVTYSWDLDGDGIYEIVDEDSVVYDSAVVGAVTVGLKAEDGVSDPATSTRTMTVLQGVYYVDAHGTSPTPPYADPASAATSIEDAVALADDGAEIRIATGDYVLTGTVEPKGGTRIVGATGRASDVSIAGTGTDRLFKLEGEGTTLANVTLKGLPGAVNVNGGGVYAETATVVSNCVFTASKLTAPVIKDKSVCGYAVYNHDATVVDCAFDGLQSSGNAYGLALYQTGADALTDRCVVKGLDTTWWQNGVNYASCLGIVASGGVIRNTLVRNNTISAKSATKSYDLGAFIQLSGSARAENCTVVENVLPTEPSDYENRTQPVFTADTSALVNCLVLSNTTAGVQRNWKSTGANLDHCCTTDAAELKGEGNVEGTARTYRTKRDGRLVLIPGSPCVDAGDDLAWTAAGLDLYGKARKTGRHVDIGAVEGGYGGLMLMLK